MAPIRRLQAGWHTWLALLVVVLIAGPAAAQGGGASSTGSIAGRVTDASGLALPGVTITAAGPALITPQVSVSSSEGAYRFAALPPGSYRVTFELPGFSTLQRENIAISLGFIATVNAELGVATLQESITVRGDAPVIDSSNTRVQQNFKLEALQEIPNARDMWALLAITPSVQMNRIDVGGSRAGTQTGYAAYGYSGQNRVLVENINVTEGTSGAGTYWDYGSFEEIFFGTIGQGAEMPTPGVQTSFLVKSGGNRLSGEVYVDYENNSLQATNISPDRSAQYGIARNSNQLETYRDLNLNLGGPIVRDKAWWFTSYRRQDIDVRQPAFVGPIADQLFRTELWIPSGKATYQVTPNHKLIGYYTWVQKVQPNRLPQGGYRYTDLGTTVAQDAGTWVYKGEWNGTLSPSVYAEARYGVFGYYLPLVPNTDTDLPQRLDSVRLTIDGGDAKSQSNRQRRQATSAVTWFKEALGSHTFKAGAELMLETSWSGVEQGASANVRQFSNDGVAQRVTLFAPTATSVGAILAGSRGDLLNVNKLDTIDAFISDQWAIGRATINLGVRYDRYHVWTPEQRQLAYNFGPLVVPAATFAETSYVTWNSFAPRLGLTYDLRGDGRTVFKGNYGYFRFNPGVNLASSANPNQSSKSVTYAWTDRNLDGYYQPGEEGSVLATALAGTIQFDKDIEQPSSNQATAFVEQDLGGGLGARAGFAYLAIRNETGTYQPFRPASAYSVPFQVVDPGIDGIRGTGDDGTVTAYGIPNSEIGAYPATNVVTNAPQDSTYRTVEFSITKRRTGTWSLGAGASHTWSHDYPAGYPYTPNGPFDYDSTSYSFKANAQYQAPFGVLLSAVYRFQSGANYARVLAVTAPASCNCTFSAGRSGSSAANTLYVSDYDDFRQDNVSVFDIRAEKSITFGPARLRVFVDGFNLLNAYAAETISATTGPAFQTPTAVLGPRTGRVGFRLGW
ncbi:MAG: carboxypeptidase regulatory-like domain-containing protein [Acidobacteria bacterium]|nr:carboxypeptidase regulatory-like domain-containing protein [Acidobacteriota bacterium]